ncbi:thiamine pyrophosphokinase [Nocardia speluncae]|uniref:Thiamine pyrophosphokinase n=1 Tax=Nocardia speluncae TaxID=419477 RepID=A0A846XGQ0_9NOCA|nr:putative cytokinetic ring protein SteA [Nocardia speluncae]NKY33773.1 thiamine pyrophosphokinase [Nocardia speluncae]
MRMLALLSKNSEALPGRTGNARVDRDTRRLLARIGPGDIAVLDEMDIDQPLADKLVAAGVTAVVNTSPSISGRYPNVGPEVLVAGGVLLLDTVSSDAFGRIKDGARVRIADGVVYADRFTRKEPEALVECLELDEDAIAERMQEARNGLAEHLESFAGDALEFIRTESSLLMDGIGVPKPDLELSGRQVVVVGVGPGHAEDLKKLGPFIKEYSPVLIGVGAGAETLRRSGYRPDLIVGNPDELTTKTLTCGAELIIPADLDGRAEGLERVKELGLGAITFPGSGAPADLALLLAHHHGAALIVTAGASASLEEFFDRGRRDSNPATFLTRLKVGESIMDASAVATLYRNRFSGVLAALLVLAVLGAAIVAILAVGQGSEMLAGAQDMLTRAELWGREVLGRSE